MTEEEVLGGLTNDLILLRLRRFFVTKGLPDGKYLLTNAELFANGQEGRHRGKIEMVLPKESQREVADKLQSPADVRVVIDFSCAHQLDSCLSLDIHHLKTPMYVGKELIYHFVGVLRPFEEKTV